MTREFAYTSVPGKIPALFERIRDRAVPPVVNPKWLTSIGFDRESDPTLIQVLKYIGFATQGGKPTSLWNEYRGANHRMVIGEAVTTSYAALFKEFGEPSSRTTPELAAFFKGNCRCSEAVASKMVATFRNLYSISDFPESPVTQAPDSRTETTLDIAGRPVQVNITIQLPETTDDEVYERIFRALKKYLLS